MTKFRSIVVLVIALGSMLVLLSNKGEATMLSTNDKSQNEQIQKSSNIIKGSSIEQIRGRQGYELGGRVINTKHFALRETTPERPFKPHKHVQSELWFIIEGEGKVSLDGVEYDVEENDLIIMDPWMEHGMKTKGKVKWICLG